MNYEHILLALELTEESRQQAEQAKVFAERFGARLSLVHVVEQMPAYGYPLVVDVENQLIAQAKDHLAQIAEMIGVPTSQQFLEVGLVRTHVVKISEEQGVDLIIVGSHGRHGLARLLGSSASAVVHEAACDVLVLRAS